MKNKSAFGANIGTSSILIIIVTLTLVCFAGLSLASANADYKLCLKLANRTTSYYEASSQVHTSLAQMLNKKESSKSDNSFTFNLPINEFQEFQAQGYINPSPNSNYLFTKYEIVTTNEPELDNSLSLLLKP